MRLIDADRLLDFIKFDERVIAPEEHTARDIVMMIQTAPTVAPAPKRTTNPWKDFLMTRFERREGLA